MIPIYLHEYTLVPWDRERIGVQQVTLVIVTKNKEKDPFASEEILKVLDKNCNVTHRLLMEGYSDE